VFNHKPYQMMLNEGVEDRPQVWLIELEDRDVVVKAVHPKMDPDCCLRSELADEVKVYKAIGKQDFIPEFVAEGKLSDRERSAIVTSFAGESINNWKHKDKAEAIEVRDKTIGALKRLHEHEFEHGDVALRNFLIDNERKVRVIDLGQAYMIDAESKPELEIEYIEQNFSEAYTQYFANQESGVDSYR
jgi:RIO-like serine/threonine protein kinase